MNPMGPPDNAQSASKSARWYFFRDGVVNGPTNVDAILGLATHGADGKETLVCRADFKKWYPLRDLSHLLKHTERQDEDARHEIKRLQDLVTRSLDSFATGRKVEGKTLGKKPSPAAKAPLPAPIQEAPIPDGPLGYYLLKGRLRLGTIRNPWVLAFLTGPLTFGLGWYFWLKNSFLELRWHLSGDFAPPKSFPPLFLVAVPGLQPYFLWKLAALLRALEEQHNYRKSSALAAALLSVFPPFAITYLQRRINLHWTMHVSHCQKGWDQTR